MATYKISYLLNSSYSYKDEHYIENVIDEYDAVETMIAKYNLPDKITILSVDLICE